MADDDGVVVLRERVARLEASFIYISGSINDVKKGVEEMRGDLSEVKDLIAQANGAKWAVRGILIMFGGALAYAPSILKIFMAAK